MSIFLSTQSSKDIIEANVRIIICVKTINKVQNSPLITIKNLTFM